MIVNLFCRASGFGETIAAHDQVEVGIDWNRHVHTSRTARHLQTWEKDVLAVPPRATNTATGLIATPPRRHHPPTNLPTDDWTTHAPVLVATAIAWTIRGGSGIADLAHDMVQALPSRMDTRLKDATITRARTLIAPAWWICDLTPRWVLLILPRNQRIRDAYLDGLEHLGYMTDTAAGAHVIPADPGRHVILAHRDTPPRLIPLPDPTVDPLDLPAHAAPHRDDLQAGAIPRPVAERLLEGVLP